MRYTIQIAALTAGSLLLGGCQLFESKASRMQVGIRVPVQPEPHAFAAAQLEEGRVALAGRSYPTAIAAFRQAALEPEFAAAAHNGLGIAYAGIGRNDIAERYFRQAAAEEPTNKRFADNLVRLQRAQFAIEQARLARAEAAAALPVARPPQVFRGGTYRAGLEAAPSQGRMVRLSPTSVIVRSSAPQPAAPRRVAVLPRVVALRASEAPTETAPLPAREPDRVKPAEPVAALAAATPAAPSTVTAPAPASAPALAATPASTRRTIVMPTTRAADVPQVAIQTTGRRYAPTEFEQVFAPFAERSDTPVVARSAVSAPGLRPLHVPEPSFGHAPQAADQDLALAGK